MSEKSVHRRELEVLALHPEYLGIEPSVLARSIETTLYDLSGRMVAEPDLLFLQQKHGRLTVYLVEYKHGTNHRAQKRAEKQLYASARWFSKIGITPKVIVANGETYAKLQARLGQGNHNEHSRNDVRNQYSK